MQTFLTIQQGLWTIQQAYTVSWNLMGGGAVISSQDKTSEALCVIRNIEAHLCNHWCSGKAISITYPVTLCAMHHVVACPAVPHFSTFSHKRHDFSGKPPLLNILCVFWFSLQLSFEKFLIQRRTERGITINIYGYSCKVPVILVRF